MKVTIDTATWYAMGNTFNEAMLTKGSVGDSYKPRLLDEQGMKCCLGFAVSAHNPNCSIYLIGQPCAIGQYLGAYDWLIKSFRRRAFNSALSDLAIEINDGQRSEFADGLETSWSHQPISVRMGNLITIFLEGGDELEFI